MSTTPISRGAASTRACISWKHREAAVSNAVSAQFQLKLAPMPLTVSLALSAAIDSALASAPLLSFRRWYPIVCLLDNNFSDDRDHLLAVCELMRSHQRIRGWGALVTQNIMHDRELVKKLACSQMQRLVCRARVYWIANCLRRYNKTQNLSPSQCSRRHRLRRVARHRNYLWLSFRPSASNSGRHEAADPGDRAATP